MNMKRSINSWQMVILFTSFQVGSAIMYVPSPLIGITKNNAWLAVIIASLIGFGLLALILWLNSKYPSYTFIDLNRHLIGRRLSLVFTVPFILMLLFMLCLILIDIKDFFKSSMMPQTPDYIFYSIILLNVALMTRAGIEIMARMFTLFLIIMYGSTIIISLLAIPFYNPEYLLPFMNDGPKPIIHGMYLLVFPFGEILLFNMLFPFLKKTSLQKLNKSLYWTHFFNAVILLVVIVLSIIVLGPLAENRSYSLFSIARLIEIGDFMERLESIIGLSITLGTVIKATIVMFMLNLALSQLLNIKNDRVLIFPLALLVFLLSSTMFFNEAEYVKAVLDIWPFIVITVSILPTLFISLLALFRKKPIQNKHSP